MAINATYKYYNGTNWVEYHFVTNAGVVNTTSARKFVTESIKVNDYTAGTNGAKVTVGTGDVATIYIHGDHIPGSAALATGATAFAYITQNDTVAVALGKLDKAAKAAYDKVPDVSGLVPYTGATGDVDLGNYDLKFGTNAGILLYDVTDNGKQISLFNSSGQYKVYGNSAKTKTAVLKFSTLTANSERTYTFPDKSGTVAMTTDIPTVGAAAAKGVATSISSSSTNDNLATAKAVYDAIQALPEPMIFKGSIGSSSATYTWEGLPTANASHEGWTLKAVSTNASMNVKTGDTLICFNAGTSQTPDWTWAIIPSGDEPSGTVTSVALSLPSIFSVSGSPVTTSGTLTATLANQAKNVVFAGPSTGSNAAPTFRSLVSADIPDLSGTYIKQTGTTSLSGDIVPNSNNSVSIGSSTKRLANVHTESIKGYGSTPIIAQGSSTYTVYADGAIKLGATNTPYGTIYLPEVTGEDTLALVSQCIVVYTGTTTPSSPKIGDLWFDGAIS